MGNILNELNQILSEKDRIVAGVAQALYNDLIAVTPVQTGYLKQSWSIREDGDGYIIDNPTVYAEIRLRPALIGDNGKLIQGSLQNPAGIEGLIDKHERQLQSLLKGIK